MCNLVSPVGKTVPPCVNLCQPRARLCRQRNLSQLWTIDPFALRLYRQCARLCRQRNLRPQWASLVRVLSGYIACDQGCCSRTQGSADSAVRAASVKFCQPCRQPMPTVGKTAPDVGKAVSTIRKPVSAAQPAYRFILPKGQGCLIFMMAAACLNERCKKQKCLYELLRKGLIFSLERETGFEPATFSLGS